MILAAGTCEISGFRDLDSRCTGALICDCILTNRRMGGSRFSNEAIKETRSLHSLPFISSPAGMVSQVKAAGQSLSGKDCNVAPFLF